MQKKISPREPAERPKHYIILDSNIYAIYNRKPLVSKLFDELRHFIVKKYGIGISEISFCEILSGMTFEKEGAALKNLNGMRSFPVTKDIFVTAAKLEYFYKRERYEIALVDRVIAATSFLTDSLILTSNIRDFPMPFFNVVETILLKHNSKRNPSFLYVYLLKPNLNVFKQYLHYREGLPESKK